MMMKVMRLVEEFKFLPACWVSQVVTLGTSLELRRLKFIVASCRGFFCANLHFLYETKTTNEQLCLAYCWYYVQRGSSTAQSKQPVTILQYAKSTRRLVQTVLEAAYRKWASSLNDLLTSSNILHFGLSVEGNHETVTSRERVKRAITSLRQSVCVIARDYW